VVSRLIGTIYPKGGYFMRHRMKWMTLAIVVHRGKEGEKGGALKRKIKVT
jgi:hypothetical protein